MKISYETNTVILVRNRSIGQPRIFLLWTKNVTSRALSTCSGAIVLLSSLLHTSLDSEDTRLINSAGKAY